MAALQLMKERLHREAAAMWDQIIRDDPDKAEWWVRRWPPLGPHFAAQLSFLEPS